MTPPPPCIMWYRRDLRTADHMALSAAAARGEAVVPVFILDDQAMDFGGAAPRWRLAQGLRALDGKLRSMGSRLILRSGRSSDQLKALIAETGAGAVYWSRLYDKQSVERDSSIKAALRSAGIEARSFAGHVLFEPTSLKTKTGGCYKVYSPFWRALRAADPPTPPVPAPEALKAPQVWPEGEAVEALNLEKAMNRGGAILAAHASVGEAAAQKRLTHFIKTGLGGYKEKRDHLDQDGASGLSEHFALGEISPRQAWCAAETAAQADPRIAQSAEVFLKEIAWREFAWHLLHHTPHIATQNWRAQWDAFPWRGESAEADAWRRGRTGQPLVDAAMRELYVTGRMHNRARMLTASFLTKHLLTHWRIGERWFRDHLTDWDPASNAMGWQWTAGSGPDAAPYFRIYNPDTQAKKFDQSGAYRARWLAEGLRSPSAEALSFFEACPRSWRLTPQDPAPCALISLEAGRGRALAAYEVLRAAQDAA